MRLQKYMADCGIASRRKCEEMIAGGRVSVNGEIITAMGFVMQDNDIISVDGNPISCGGKKHYYAFNKPSGVISSSSDDRGRKTVLDYFKTDERLFVVGRLDYDTEGLIFVTNDGEFANKVTHPRYESTKLYEAVCAGAIDKEGLQRLRNGVVIDGRLTSKADVKILSSAGNRTILHIAIHEGRNRQIRKMIDAVGSSVMTLKRIRIGPVLLNGLKTGAFRQLNSDEVNFFLNK